ncbi:hypothetical protein AD954_14595 [Acetobacter cerevisiae]|uniref:Uncharacterized protein n=1 Tax=Acetobacter cerevisiae TaxID=178900 RepID=A0A149V668_9PROT|nr:hypothetical protein AD954_14595 [Acetobacter cerevisiae]
MGRFGYLAEGTEPGRPHRRGDRISSHTSSRSGDRSRIHARARRGAAASRNGSNGSRRRPPLGVRGVGSARCDRQRALE